MANELVSEGLAELSANPDHRTSPLLALAGRGRSVLSRIGKLAAVENRRVLQAVGIDAVRDTRRNVLTLVAAPKD